jgi:hypothetical protein
MIATRRGGVTGLTIALQEELGEAFPNLSDRIGIVLPMIGEMGEGLFEAAQQSGPLLLAMTQMQGRIPMLGSAMRLLFNPITLLGGGLFILVRHWDTLGPMLQRVSGQFRDFTRDLLQRVMDIDWAQVGTDLVDGLLSIFGIAGESVRSREMSETARAFADGFRNLFMAVGTAVRGMVAGMWDRIVAFIFEPATITGRIQRGAGVAGVAVGAAMFTPLRGPIISAAMGLFRSIGGFLSSGAGAVLRGGLRGVLTKVPVIGAVLGVLFDLPEIIDSFQTGGITQGLQRLFHSILNGLLLGIPDLIGDVFGTDIFSTIFGFLFEALNIGNISRAIEAGDWPTAIFEGLFAGLNIALYGLPGIIRAGLAELLGFDMFGTFWSDVIRPTLSDLGDFWNDEIVPLWEEALIAWEDLSFAAMEFWEDTLEPMLIDLQKLWKDVFIQYILPTAKRVWRDVGRGATVLWQRVLRPMLLGLSRLWVDTFASNLRAAVTVFQRVATVAVTAFQRIRGAIRELIIRWAGWREILSRGWDAIGVTIRTTIGQAIEFASFHFQQMVDNWQLALLGIERGFRMLPVRMMVFFRDFFMGDSPMARGIRAVLSAMGVEIGTVTDGFNEALGVLTRNVAGADTEMTRIQTAMSRREQQYTEAVRRAAEERTRAIRAVTTAYDIMNRASDFSRERMATTLREQLNSINSVADGALGAIDAMDERTQRFIQGVATGEYARRAQQRRLQESFEVARPVVMELTRAVGAGEITQEQFQTQVAQVEEHVREGRFREGRAEAVLEAVGLGEEPVVEEERARPRGRVPRAPARATPRPAGEDEVRAGTTRTEERIATAEEQQARRDELMQVNIAGISSEAARILARTMSSGRTGPTDVRRRRAPPSPEPGTQEAGQ